MQLRLERVGERILEFCLVDVVEFVHAVQDVAAAHVGIGGAAHRVVAGRCREHPRECRGFGDGDVRQRFAVVDLRRGGDAVGALAEEHLVQEERHDLFL